MVCVYARSDRGGVHGLNDGIGGSNHGHGISLHEVIGKLTFLRQVEPDSVRARTFGKRRVPRRIAQYSVSIG